MNPKSIPMNAGKGAHLGPERPLLKNKVFKRLHGR